MNFETLSIHTPVVAAVLADYLKGYHDFGFVVSGFSEGFGLGMVPNPNLGSCSKRYPVKEQLRAKICDEVSKGRIIGPFHQAPLGDLMVSPVCVIPKPNSEKVRMIFNLSHPRDRSVNDNIDQSFVTVSYCSVTDVVRWLMHNDLPGSSGWFMGKLDLADAYRIVPIRKEDWKFLGMSVGKDIYVDRCLPMGAVSSCRTFQRISDALAWIVMTTCPVSCTIFNYLDDFLVLAKTQDFCNKAVNHFTALCQEMGFPLASQKTVWPSQRIVFLGIGIDSHDRILFIPVDKANKSLDHLRKFMSKSKPLVSEWQGILGKLIHLTQVVFAGRPYMSSLYGSLSGILSKHKHLRRRISLEAREDLQVWEQFLAGLPPNKPFRMFNDQGSVLHIYTDASKSEGYGAVFGNVWFSGTWPNDKWKGLNICVLELYPIYAALSVWRDSFSNETVDVHTDNQALVSVLNKLYSKDRLVRWLLKPLALLCLGSNIRVVAHHVRGEDNVRADMLSRGKLAQFRQKFRCMYPEPAILDKDIKPESLTLPPVDTKHCRPAKKRSSCE